MKNKPTVFVIIAVHNRKNITEHCLVQLNSQDYKPLQIIVIDDGSNDGTSEMIRKEYPNVHLFHGDGNYWWSKSMNLGLDFVLQNAKKQDLVLTLNDDTIFDSNYIDIIVNESKKYPNHLIGSINLIKGNPDKVFSAGGKYDLLFSMHNPNIKQNVEYNSLRIREYYETDYLPGRGSLIPINIFERIGKFNSEKYPQYIADEEFSFRAKRDGFKCIVSTKAKIYTERNTSGFENVNSKITIKSFLKSLTAINSTNNIKCRIHFAKSYAKIPILFIIINITKMLFANIARIIGIRKSL